MAKRKGLGRGLDALLGGVSPSMLDGTAEAAAGEASALRSVPVERLQRGRFQPRVVMDESALDALAASIREQGVLQPIVVRAQRDGDYEILAGERRWRAAQRAGLAEVPVLVREVDDQAALAIALIENIQREGLNAMEEARALDRLVREFDLTHARAAEAVGRSRAAVSNLLRLLELAPDVAALVESGTLEMGHARALLALPAAGQSRAARAVVQGAMSVRETERLVKRVLEEGAHPPVPAPRDPDVMRLERRLGERLGARVELKSRRGGKGTLTIHYTSLDELDGILARFDD